MNKPNEIEMVDALAEQVRAGRPIHVTGPFDQAQWKMYIEMSNRLVAAGLPVQVSYGLPVHVINN